MPSLLKMPPSMICFVVVILISSEQSLDAKEIIFDTTTLTINQEVYSLEIAKTQDQRQRGLMFREKLGPRKGMIFIYPNSTNHRIWMKNTKIKLTVIWIDEEGRVLDIQRLDPCRQDPCPSYGVGQPSKYILELNNQAHSINLGDKIFGISQI